jgi:L-amino acid N-acyltransferase YncA
LLELLRRQRFVNAYAGITLPNDASVGLHRSIGMEQIGTYERVGYKFGQWLGVTWFGMRLNDPAEPPAEPIPFPQLGG